MDLLAHARQAIDRCRSLAECTEEPGFTTRTFLSPPMHQVHSKLRAWMEPAGISFGVDNAGNVRGCYPSARTDAPRIFFGSHLDTVPRAGAFDGILGVVIAVELIELLAGRRLNYHLEIVGFSEEEGIRFGVPFLGSRAFVGTLDDSLLSRCDAGGTSVSTAIRTFGLTPERIHEAAADNGSPGFIEFHIEQGPVLESFGYPLGIVKAICGQSRLSIVFEGKANHAGTTPMHLRRDALTAAAEWIGVVETEAKAIAGLVATVGFIEAEPGAVNVIPSRVRASLDVRHADDNVRKQSVAHLLECAYKIASRRGLTVSSSQQLDQSAVAMDLSLTRLLEQSVASAGYPVHAMVSGAGHDTMIVSQRMPVAMLFVRSPGGVSHHPDETVLLEDVAAALAAGMHLVDYLDGHV